MSTDDDAADVVHRWERRLLIAAFGGWALVVAAYGQAAVNRIDRITEEMQRDREQRVAAEMLMERRVTILEQRQAAVIETLRSMKQTPAIP